MGGEAQFQDPEGSAPTCSRWPLEDLARVGLRVLRVLGIPLSEQEDLLHDAILAVLQHSPQNPPRT
jgi:hypothetical protein